MEYFSKIAQGIHRRFRACHYDSDRFPAIAAEALAYAPPHKDLAYTDIIRWVQQVDCLPEQLDPRSQFGMPPVTVYHGDHFVIDVYFWPSGATGIHQHSFDGAFTLLTGSSLHCSYDFEVDTAYSHKLLGGTLHKKDVEVLQKGVPVEVPVGTALIHSVFHLDDPTVTVLARSTRTRPPGPTFDYEGSGLAVDARSSLTRLQKRQLETLLYAATTDWRLFEELLVKQFRETDPWHVYLILDAVRTQFSGRRRSLQRVLDVVHERFPGLTDKMIACFMEDTRRKAFDEAHGASSCQRTIDALAALYMLDSPKEVCWFIRQRDGEQDPAASILGALEKLNLLPADGDEALTLAVLRHALCRDASAVATPTSRAAGLPSVAGREREFEQEYKRLERSSYLRAVFAGRR